MPCHTNDHDEKAIERAIKTVGCKPPQIKEGGTRLYCRGVQQMVAFYHELHEKKQTPACKSIQSIYEWYKETDKSKQTRKNYSKMVLYFHFEEYYFKEIVYLKEYSTESLIGNIGGYIGKFSVIIMINALHFCLNIRQK